MPVREVVAAYKKKKNIWGIEGYDLPKYNANYDNVRRVRMIKDNRPSFLDEAVKIKKFVPEPTLYEVSGNLVHAKKKSGLSKGKRIMMPEEIEIYEKKNQKPPPGEYNPQLKTKFLGAFNLKDKKSTSFLDEAEYLSL